MVNLIPLQHRIIELTDFRAIDKKMLWSTIQKIKGRKFPFSVGFYPELSVEKELKEYF